MSRRIIVAHALWLVVPFSLFTLHAGAQGIHVDSFQRISNAEGGFGGVLYDPDRFGSSIASLGDLDGDGVVDLAVGSPWFNTATGGRGSLWILFMTSSGTVKSEQQISEGIGGFSGAILPSSWFGTGVTGLGDLDGDGVPDLAVSGDYGSGDGAVWVLFLNANGTVKAQQKIANGVGGFPGGIDHLDWFGAALAGIGDLDGDGVVDLAAGAPGDDDGFYNAGAVWILFLRNNGTVKDSRKISATSGGFGGILDQDDSFGQGLCSPGDVDGDGVMDLAVGAIRWAPHAGRGGLMWVVFLAPDGTVKSQQQVGQGVGGFVGQIGGDDFFGYALSSVGDLDGNGVVDVLLGEINDNDSGYDAGAAWILFLQADGTLVAQSKIAEGQGGFTGGLNAYDHFGRGLAGLGDLDGDGHVDIAVGANGDNGGSSLDVDRGAVWVLFLDECAAASATLRNPYVGGFANPAVYAVNLLPILGGTFRGSVVTTGKTGSFLVGYSAPLTASAWWGNVLVDFLDPNGELLGWPVGLGDPALIDLPVPNDHALCGFTLSTQGVRFGGGVDLTNAQDLVIGL